MSRDNIVVLTDGMVAKGWSAKTLPEARRFAEMLAKGYNKREDVIYVARLVAVCRKDTEPGHAPVQWQELEATATDAGNDSRGGAETRSVQ